MENKTRFISYLFVLFIFSGSTLAQDYEYHPVLSDNFIVSLGGMRSSNSFKVRSSLPGIPGDVIDFDDGLDVSDHSTFFNGQLRWKFGKEKKWSISGQYFSNNAKGSSELEQDVEWNGVTFREGSFVGSGLKIEVARVFFGRSFIKNDRNDFGVGIGVHSTKIKAFIEGDIAIDDASTGFRREEVDVSQPVPNIGAWYNFSPARRWLLHARVDWISLSVGDFDGTLWNTSVGVNFQAWRHVGIDLSWQYFNVNVGVDSVDWTGDADLTYSGPVLGITGTW